MSRWARFRSNDGHVGFGLVEGTHILEHEGDLFADKRPTGRKFAQDAVTLLSPCAPSKIVALWNNFHALAGKLGKPVPTHPQFLLKPGTSTIGPNEPILRPRAYAGKIVYEGELGIVIGKRCKDVAPGEAADHIFGLTCVNDVTAIGVLNENPDFAQWCRSKGYDTFGCIGPRDCHRARLVDAAGGHPGRWRRAPELSAVGHDFFGGGHGEPGLPRHVAVGGRCDRVRHLGRRRIDQGWLRGSGGHRGDRSARERARAGLRRNFKRGSLAAPSARGRSARDAAHACQGPVRAPLRCPAP